ncbi:hypothetical protein KBB05_04910 [Patescibacteria group bacterium]|nr:hypothetical protein [Patescibacteria group bacterium]
MKLAIFLTVCWLTSVTSSSLLGSIDVVSSTPAPHSSSATPNSCAPVAESAKLSQDCRSTISSSVVLVGEVDDDQIL